MLHMPGCPNNTPLDVCLSSLVLDSASLGVLWTNKDGDFVFVNKKICSVLGYTREELLKKNVLEINTEINTMEKWNSLLEKIQKNQGCELRTQHIARDGTKIPVLVHASYFKVSGEEYRIAFIEDMTEQDKTTERMVALASFPNLNPNPVVEISPKGTVSFANPSALVLFPDIEKVGISHPWLLGYDKVNNTVRDICVNGVFYRQYFHKVNDTIRIYGFDITFEKKHEETLRNFASDLEQKITERTAELANERNKFQRIFSTTSEGLVVVNADGDICDANTSFCNMVGIKNNTQGINLFNLVGENSTLLKSVIDDAVSFGKSSYGNKITFFNESQNRHVPTLTNASLFEADTESHSRVLLSIVNITEIIEWENKMIRSESLAVVGTLAAGVAHEFNNINAIIKGHLDLLISDRESMTVGARDQLSVVRKMISRASDITSNLLLFARGNGKGKKCVSVASILEDTILLIENEFKSLGIKIYRGEIPYELYVSANPNQLSQVFMNIFLNAKDAMLQSEKKQLFVEIERCGSWVHTKISDTGCGIPEEDLKNMFVPFFTTKGEFSKTDSPMAGAKGTGLGMAVSHNIIVKHHGGRISVNSKVGEGTSFDVSLPIVEKQIHVTKKSKRAKLEMGHNKRVLVLDDELELVKILDQMLSINGYTTFCTDSGLQALAEHEQNPFDAVVVDLQMPNMTGVVFIEKLNVLPNVPAKIVLTGLSKIADNEDSRLGIYRIIKKPFDIEDLLLSVQESIRNNEKAISNGNNRNNT